MFNLVYVSSAVTRFNNNELVEMLKQSREKNLRLGITGMLLYMDGNFMQLLEGDKRVVLDLYATIKADPRHHGLIEILEGEIEKPTFVDWSMGFRNMSDPQVLELLGYTRFLDITFDYESFEAHPSVALELLKLFRKT